MGNKLDINSTLTLKTVRNSVHVVLQGAQVVRLC